MATAVYLSGFLTDSVGRLVITQEQWDTCLDGLPDEAARAAAQPDARHLALAGALSADIKIRIGAANKTEWHPSGYWVGDDALHQVVHAITIFKILHPGVEVRPSRKFTLIKRNFTVPRTCSFCCRFDEGALALRELDGPQ
mmetsp:Transcript_18800/g.42700  ORF Transcript_18800/g.42700 Transcript_18800/m.42700 type:complete len:141 (-) Transcript_18800:42-464(-)